jgi:tetratricopeptide (TPR) repeat protein
VLATLALSLVLAGEASPQPAPAAPPLSPAAGGGERGATAPALSALLAEADRAYAERDQPGKLEIVAQRLAEAEKLAPDDYDVLWRQARRLFWISDDPSLANDRKSELGKKAWEYGDRAHAKDPKRVEGWYYAAVGAGNYSLGIGILSALAKGIEGKYKERLKHAEEIDPKFEHGAIQTAWGRFYFKLPWPKYDGGKSERYLIEALKNNPDNVRARVYLADLWEKEDKPEKAREQLEKAVANPPDRYDPPEERRYQAIARARLEPKKK